jgi:hypothetical protein
MEEQNLHYKPENNMVLAIFTTVCCCLPIGIYAIIRASKVNSLFAAQQYDEAQKAADDAKKWSFIGIGVGLVVNIIWGIVNYGAMMSQMQ